MKKLKRTGVPLQARWRDVLLFPLQIICPWLFTQ